VIEHVQAHLHEPLPVAELAALVFQSPFHFSRQFKSATGVSPHQFVMLARLDRSRELLVDTRLSCRHVAVAAGFGTHSHFTGVFTRWVGMSPARFRRHILQSSMAAPRDALSPAGEEGDGVGCGPARRQLRHEGSAQRTPDSG